MSGLLPNTYQKPNKYSDLYDYYLTPEESRVLDFFIRHILGWEENRETRRNRLSLSHLVKGWQSKEEGRWRTLGTGLSRPTVVKAVESLIAFGFIREIGPATQDGQEYELVLDDRKINLDALIARKEGRKSQDQKRTQAARDIRRQMNEAVNEIDQGDDVVNEINHLQLMPLTDGSKCDLPPVVNAINTINPSINPLINPPDKPTNEWMDERGPDETTSAASCTPVKARVKKPRKGKEAAPADAPAPAPVYKLCDWLDYFRKIGARGPNLHTLAARAERDRVTPNDVDRLIGQAQEAAGKRGQELFNPPGFVFVNVMTYNHGWDFSAYPDSALNNQLRPARGRARETPTDETGSVFGAARRQLEAEQRQLQRGAA